MSANPFEELEALFAAMESRAANPEPVLEEIGSKMLSEAREAFEDRASPNGSRWPSLSLATAAIGKRGTGALKNSLRVAQDGLSLSLASPLPYAAAQNFGNPNNKLFGSSKRAPIPARPFSPVEEEKVPDSVRAAIGKVFGYIFEGNESE